MEALINDLDLQQGNTSPAPGSKPKPIARAEHQAMMERRLEGEQGGDSIIANLKAENGRLRKEIERMTMKVAPSSPGKVRRKSPDASNDLNKDCTIMLLHSRAVGTRVPGVHVHPLFFRDKGTKSTLNFVSFHVS